jgi:hypothetical protein
MYNTTFPKERKNDGLDGLRPWWWQPVGVSVLGIGAGGVLLSQAFQDEASYRQDLLRHFQELGNVLDR